MHYKQSVEDISVSGKKVLLRCDLNVPRDDEGNITNDKRIRASLPTIEYLLNNGAAVIACSHLGRPKGEVNPKLSLSAVGKRLSELLGRSVFMAKDIVGEETKAKAAALKPGEIMLLENVRFDGREEKNDPEFSKELASMAEIFVSDAFGTCHRAHSSTAGVADYLPAVCGYLVQKEINAMGKAVMEPQHPFAVILGGAKVSDKITVIANLANKVDIMLIGGGMAFTFIKALGGNIGNSLCEENEIETAKSIMEKMKERNIKFLLPIDTMVGDHFGADAEPVLVDAMNIPDGYMGLDIGPKTIEKFKEALQEARTVIWNGPMGVFEFPAFAKGTEAVAHIVADLDAITIVGGGDSSSAVEKMGFADKITHVSTGGGASLEFLEGKMLPGIACLLDKAEDK